MRPLPSTPAFRRAAGTVAVLLAALLAPAALADQRAAAVAVMEATPPFSYRESDGTLTGFNVEIMRELCRAMDVDCTFVEIRFQDLAEAVAAGRFDYGLGNFLRTPERERALTFSAPYWRSSSSLIGPADEGERPLAEAVRGRSVAVIRGSRQHAHMHARTEVGELLVVRHLDEVWSALESGRAEFTLLPTLAGLPFLMTRRGRDFATVGGALVENGLGGTVHIVMPPGRADLKEAVDRAIAATRANGAYQRINRLFFPFDVY